MIQSTLLNSLSIVHGYSERTENRVDFLKKLNIFEFTQGRQVHGVTIAKVTEKNKGKILPGIDGLVSHGLPLGVTFADCVPILAIDPKAKIIGTAHAGWKGTLAGIAKELIRAMRNIGANSIYISIGPSIGSCCYSVPKKRADKFSKQVVSEEHGIWYVDLQQANYEMFINLSIPKDHIDVIHMCTSCNIDKFNSYRKDPRKTFGVQLGVIAL